MSNNLVKNMEYFGFIFNKKYRKDNYYVKKTKTLTKIIALLLSIIMVNEICPTNAIAAYVTSVDTQSNSEEIENKYNESYNFYYDSHSIDIGRAGTLKVNDYILQPSLEFKSLGISGNIFPINIQMKYNSAEY